MYQTTCSTMILKTYLHISFTEKHIYPLPKVDIFQTSQKSLSLILTEDLEIPFSICSLFPLLRFASPRCAPACAVHKVYIRITNKTLNPGSQIVLGGIAEAQRQICCSVSLRQIIKAAEGPWWINYICALKMANQITSGQGFTRDLVNNSQDSVLTPFRYPANHIIGWDEHQQRPVQSQYTKNY